MSWSNGRHVNDDGECVWLFQPIEYAGRFSVNDESVSYVGGKAGALSSSEGKMLTPETPNCGNCRGAMHLLVRFVRHSDKTRKQIFHIFGCNKGSCGQQIHRDSPSFSLGGGGCFVCLKSWSSAPTENSKQEESSLENQDTACQPTTPTTATWDTVDKNNDDDDDWGDDDDDNDMDKMEDLLRQMEMKGPTGIAQQPKPKKSIKNKTKSDGNSSSDGPSFVCFQIVGTREPAGKKQSRHDDDDDDVGMEMTFSSARSKRNDNDKIQQMLSRYMQEEEDEGILAALQNDQVASFQNNTSLMEQDERLSPEDSAMMRFSDRVKRLPRQVLRSAPGGEPIWSIPTSRLVLTERGGSKRIDIDLTIPPCPTCGTKRIFDFQVMPQLLHILKVEQHFSQQQQQNRAAVDMLGAQNWGTLAVFSCPACCSQTTSGSAQEFMIVQQDAIDGSLPLEQQRRCGDGVMASQVVDPGENDEEDFDDTWEEN